jgi:uncharacterized membrane protein YhaH (DUF805 family)
MDQIDFNKLWQNFVDTITNHYADFTGRVGRGRFWYYVLVYVVVGILISFVSHIVLLHGGLNSLYDLALLLPSVGITARRLQDTGRPGTLAWLLLVPLGVLIFTGIITVITILTFGIGAILFVLVPIASLLSLVAICVLIYFCAQPGDAGANAYGPPPSPWTPNRDPVTPPPAAS